MVLIVIITIFNNIIVITTISQDIGAGLNPYVPAIVTGAIRLTGTLIGGPDSPPLSATGFHFSRLSSAVFYCP